ncbi:biotin/lipoyl-containing protein, partial [Candidatus Propionivibrio aalborgensis]|uniref:biotin/lipoyl-containing protein n=1 Tax=Candidatus Propionivibrio aalborgensis TaxID=1860101 RepID=UPI000AE5BFA7
MSQVIEVKVPDIGDFKDVPIIELCVKAGDTVNAEDALVTLESDKATIDIPSPTGGVIKELKVNIGDKVSEGSLIAVLEAADAASPSAQAPAAAPTQATAAPAAATTASSEVAAPPAA